MDAETLSYYLSFSELLGHMLYPVAPNLPIQDFDVVVLYYSSATRSSSGMKHQTTLLQNNYIRIAELLAAGTVESHLILAYFDCALNRAHATLCSQVGVETTSHYSYYYPTLHFISLSGQSLTTRHNGTGSATSDRLLPLHVTPFAGNFQQSEAILDWIQSMSILSRAARQQRLHRWLFGDQPFAS